MSFDVSKHLGGATMRAKSDVANKLVGMFLHEVSRKITAKIGLGVRDSRYAHSVTQSFGTGCLYCGKALELDRAAVEHLDGMNRFRAGLHIVGNVALSCVRCNREKRRDDQTVVMHLAPSGWECFLSHDGTRCQPKCMNCLYWRTLWPDEAERGERLTANRLRILEFRKIHSEGIRLNDILRSGLIAHLDEVYRECQAFATESIRRRTEETLAALETDSNFFPPIPKCEQLLDDRDHPVLPKATQ
jgi:Fe2+ or Zn2+ uptake regulation protein